jgi:TolA-binding protein
VCALVVASLGFASSPAAAQLGNIRGTLSALEGEMTRLERAYADQIKIVPGGTYEERMSQGELFFVLGEWERAALVLGGVLLDPGAERLPGYADGLYQLAEALYQLDNFGSAREYFETLLTLRGHRYRDLVMQRLIAITVRFEDIEQLEKYFRDYQAIAGGDIPSEIRYHYGRGLFLVRKDAEAVDALAVIPEGDSFRLRSRYMMAATKVRASDLEGALADFDALRESRLVAPEDKAVLELVYIARGRLFYELDRLGEAIDSYQFIQWDSDLLTTMLYEVTWTYVRRGQLALSDEELSESDRKEAALAQYELALRQLDDLRALEPDSTRAADFTLLAGQLRLQRGDYGEASQVFEEVLNNYAAADQTLRKLLAHDMDRKRIIDDIIAMESGALSVETELPAIAARRAADNEEVADAVRVFRDIDVGRQDIEAAEKMLEKLETLLNSENRAELFPELREALGLSYTLANNILATRAEIATFQNALVAKQDPSLAGRLEEAKRRREDLAAKVATLPTSGEALTERKERFDEGYSALDDKLHKATMELNNLRAQLTAVDLLYGEQLRSSEMAPTALENTKRKIQEFQQIVADLESQRESIRQDLSDTKLMTTLSGGKGAKEGSLRDAYAAALDEENALMSSLNTAQAREARELDTRAQQLWGRNRGFLDQLNAVVDSHVAGVKHKLAEIRTDLSDAAQKISTLSTDAQSIRDAATRIALDHVRAEVQDIVVRADVGLIDVAFARKQRETEKIGRLQRQKSEELTQLNQAYADLTSDEAAD